MLFIYFIQLIGLMFSQATVDRLLENSSYNNSDYIRIAFKYIDYFKIYPSYG